MAATRRDRQDGSDGAAMGEADDAPAFVPRRDSFDRRADTCGDRHIGLRTGNDVPALLLEDLEGARVTFGDVTPVAAAFPLAEVNLGQGRLDSGH